MIMATAIRVNKIVREIEELDYSSQLNILSRVVNLLKKSDEKKIYNLTDLKGLGKEIWQNHNVDDYIAKERESWD
ncbi:hypothetical protein AGMMS50239_38400 [Bacteroidia bacterium]|nr:hypothetical protein AGMMS50239_38400 [Bacteroidia bacterium]